ALLREPVDAVPLAVPAGRADDHRQPALERRLDVPDDLIRLGEVDRSVAAVRDRVLELDALHLVPGGAQPPGDDAPGLSLVTEDDDVHGSSRGAAAWPRHRARG